MPLILAFRRFLFFFKPSNSRYSFGIVYISYYCFVFCFCFFFLSGRIINIFTKSSPGKLSKDLDIMLTVGKFYRWTAIQQEISFLKKNMFEFKIVAIIACAKSANLGIGFKCDFVF